MLAYICHYYLALKGMTCHVHIHEILQQTEPWCKLLPVCPMKQVQFCLRASWVTNAKSLTKNWKTDEKKKERTDLKDNNG